MFLEIKGIKKHYGEGESRVEVLNGIDIEVNKGEIVVLLGPSGSGKSTLLNIIGGIDDADEGYISIDGEKTADMNEKRLTQYRRKHLGYVFQMYNLIPKAIGKAGAASAKEIVENDLVKSTPAYKNNHIVYLENPNVWYTAEGGIQALDMMLKDLEKGLGVK